MTRLILAFCFACSAAAALAQGEKSTALDAYTRTLRDLGACEAKLGELGRLRILQADAIDGRVFDADGAKARIEQANPDFMFDPKTFKISLKGRNSRLCMELANRSRGTQTGQNGTNFEYCQHPSAGASTLQNGSVIVIRRIPFRPVNYCQHQFLTSGRFQ